MKESQHIKVEIKSARPNLDSKIPVPRIATEKLADEHHRERGRSKSITRDKENARLETLPKATEIKETETKKGKRPTSAPPKRPQEDSLLSKVQAGVRNKANQLSSRREMRPTNESMDGVGQRLYQHAQEIEKKREKMRQSLEPEYSFTPQIAQSTDKWLLHRVTKGAPRPPPDEVAVVSSSSVLSFLNNNSLKDKKTPFNFASQKTHPVIPCLRTNGQQPVRPTEECLSKRYQEDNTESQILSVVEYDQLSEDM